MDGFDHLRSRKSASRGLCEGRCFSEGSGDKETCASVGCFGCTVGMFSLLPPFHLIFVYFGFLGKLNYKSGGKSCGHMFLLSLLSWCLSNLNTFLICIIYNVMNILGVFLPTNFFLALLFLFSLNFRIFSVVVSLELLVILTVNKQKSRR